MFVKVFQPNIDIGIVMVLASVEVDTWHRNFAFKPMNETVAECLGPLQRGAICKLPDVQEDRVFWCPSKVDLSGVGRLSCGHLAISAAHLICSWGG